MSQAIADELVVNIHYTLTDAEGTVIDSSQGKDPLGYIHGKNNLIPGLEKELTGKAPGDKLNVVVAPAEAYGELNPALEETVPKSMFQGVENIEVGMAFQAQGPDGQAKMVSVTKVDGDNVTIDSNHPLAGKELHFDVEVVDLREATSDELAQGHI